MDALQSYVFENSTDFKEIHYIKIMELMLKAHNQIQQPSIYASPLIPNEVYRSRLAWDGYWINQMTIRHNIVKEKVITFEEWFGIKDELFFNPSSFIIKMQEITFLPDEETVNVKIIFPECLVWFERQKIHINASQNGFITFTAGKNDNIPRLHVFLRNNNFLII